MMRSLPKIWYSFVFTLPYYALRGLALIAGQKREDVWKRLPFKDLKSLLILPDGNLLLCSWRDGPFWTWAIIEEIYYFRAYEMFFKPEKNFTIIDVGAHIGIYTLKAAKNVGKRGRVIAIEPENRNFELLVKNVKINRYKNVIPVKLALSNFEGKARLYIKSLTLSHSLQKDVEIHKECASARKIIDITEVTVMSMSNLMNELGILKIDLLKIDAEGAEFEVLKGSENLLAQHRISKIVVAAYHTSDEVKIIEEYLGKLGYKINIVEVSGRKYLYAMCPSVR